jgi:hypothetical protein
MCSLESAKSLPASQVSRKLFGCPVDIYHYKEMQSSDNDDDNCLTDLVNNSNLVLQSIIDGRWLAFIS